MVININSYTHSPLIKNKIYRILLNNKLVIVFLRICHSSLVYFSLYLLPIKAGIIITTSIIITKNIMVY